MIVVVILAILASIGVPQYVSALRIARTTKAKEELRTIAHAIDSYAANHGGELPLTLYQVGYGGRRDPWGTPYCYLNYADGTGDGLQWAIEAGLVDPSALVGGASGGSSTPQLGGFLAFGACGPVVQGQGHGRTGTNNGNGNGGTGTNNGGENNTGTNNNGGENNTGTNTGNSHAAAGNSGNSGSSSGSVSRAAGRISANAVATAATGAAATASQVAGSVAAAVAAVRANNDRTFSPVEQADLTSSLTSAGSFSLFVGVTTETTRRRDRYMFPLNTDYDLFSLGADAATAVALGDTLGRDDVIRASNGGFFGVASDY